MKVVLATPTMTRPHPAYVAALEASLPALDGLDHSYVAEIGCPYISAARATLLRKAMDAKADVVVFIDHDLSWHPMALRRLIDTEGDVVAGTYRYKKSEEEYMGSIFTGPDGRPIVRADGAISAHRVPAGFLKVTAAAVDRFMTAYPNLCCGPKFALSVDLFNHGAHEGIWYGEDMAFSRNWLAAGGALWIVPDLDLTHHSPEAAFPGNFHRFLRRQPGGSEAPERMAA